jgi:hypothetical protein
MCRRKWKNWAANQLYDLFIFFLVQMIEHQPYTSAIRCTAYAKYTCFYLRLWMHCNRKSSGNACTYLAFGIVLEVYSTHGSRIWDALVQSHAFSACFYQLNMLLAFSWSPGVAYTNIFLLHEQCKCCGVAMVAHTNIFLLHEQYKCRVNKQVT